MALDHFRFGLTWICFDFELNTYALNSSITFGLLNSFEDFKMFELNLKLYILIVFVPLLLVLFRDNLFY